MNLANDVVTIMVTYWDEQGIDMSVTRDCLPLISSQCTLYRLTLDNLILESRSTPWSEERWKEFGNHPQNIMLELFRKERHFPDSFKDPEGCFQSICHYHEHNGDVIEQADCTHRLERGCNTWMHYETKHLRQVKWKW